MLTRRVRIPARFRGPQHSGNGGYTAGLVAELLAEPCEVTLRSPPPLDVELELSGSRSRAELRHGETLVAEGVTLGALELELPAAVSFDDALAASRGFPWRSGHVFPECFVCGTARQPGDGLCLHPGPLRSGTGAEAPQLVAAGWIPDAGLAFGTGGGEIDPRFVWSALDCPAWFGFAAFGPDVPPKILLGRIAVSIQRRPRVGERCTVVGWYLGREGHRRLFCASALFSAEERQSGPACLAYSRSTWITLEPS
jgi:hypothetical protein